MTTQHELDLQGNFRTHPLAELIIEISQAKLSGSLRCSQAENKAIFYFEQGRLGLAVSNHRSLRLADTLLKQGLLDEQTLTETSQIGNDIQLLDLLSETGRVSNEEAKRIMQGQCIAVLRSVIRWPEGDWTFSTLARLKTGLSYNIDFYGTLFEYGQGLRSDETKTRFRGLDEIFVQRPDADPSLDLRPQEAFVLSRFDSDPLTLERVMSLSGLAQPDAMQALYVLWLGGLLLRKNWNPAFSDVKISTILSAQLEVKKRPPKPLPKPVPVKEEPEPETNPVEEISLEEHLDRIGSADDYYHVLAIEPNAKVNTVRRSYFALAKLLHPDRYRNETAELRTRIEAAFAEVTQAHETLKNNESRRTYDIRIKQEHEDRERARASGVSIKDNKQEALAAEDFERGFRLQLEGDFEAAMPYLARAVYYAPKNARYHAFYGRVLSADDAQRHKAEGELQAAVRLEPRNETFRIMLAEFFIRFNLLRRAEGELTRLLKDSPSNKEAKAMLDSITAK